MENSGEVVGFSIKIFKSGYIGFCVTEQVGFGFF